MGALFPDIFRYLEVNIDDTRNSDISKFFLESNKFIGDAIAGGGTVLIHCRMGTSRSVALTMAYLIAAEQMTLRSSLIYILKQRSTNPDAPYTHPNLGFFKQLISFERDVHGLHYPSLSSRDYRAKFSQSAGNIDFNDPYYAV